jgi:hypothetical protein
LFSRLALSIDSPWGSPFAIRAYDKVTGALIWHFTRYFGFAELSATADLLPIFDTIELSGVSRADPVIMATLTAQHFARILRSRMV